MRGAQGNMAGVKARAARSPYWMRDECPVCAAPAGRRCMLGSTGSVAHVERMALPPRKPVARADAAGAARRTA